MSLNDRKAAEMLLKSPKAQKPWSPAACDKKIQEQLQTMTPAEVYCRFYNWWWDETVNKAVPPDVVHKAWAYICLCNMRDALERAVGALDNLELQVCFEFGEDDGQGQQRGQNSGADDLFA